MRRVLPSRMLATTRALLTGRPIDIGETVRSEKLKGLILAVDESVPSHGTDLNYRSGRFQLNRRYFSRRGKSE